jgi:hypothetical protein
MYIVEPPGHVDERGPAYRLAGRAGRQPCLSWRDREEDQLSRPMHATVHAATVGPARANATMARSGALLVLTGWALNELTDELGGPDQAVRRLLRASTNAGTPIGVNLETNHDRSSTVFMAPRCWTPERLRCWVAGQHEAIEGIFGAATPVPLEDL